MINPKLLDKQSVSLGNLLEGTHGYAIKKISHNIKGDIILLTSDDERARSLYSDIRYFNPEALIFASWDSAPYDLVSPSKGILEERIKTLSRLTNNPGQKILVTSISAFIQKTIPKDILAQHTLHISKGESLDRQSLIDTLISNGYTRSSSASEAGEFSVRGSILDIFANGEKQGFRIDFFGNNIELIKTFNPGTQTSTGTKDSVHITPSSEFIFSNEYIEKLKDSLLNIAGPNVLDLELIQNLKDGIKPNTLEQYIPLVYKCSNITDYLNSPTIILDKFLQHEEKHIFENIHSAYNQRIKQTKLKKSILPPEFLWCTEDEYKQKLNEYKIIKLEPSSSNSCDINLDVSDTPNFKLLSQEKKLDPLVLLKEYALEQYSHKRNIIISAPTEGAANRIKRMLADNGLQCTMSDYIPTTFQANICIITSPMTIGYSCKEYALLTERNIFGESTKKIRKKKSASNQFQDLSSFEIGEFVVHSEYGVAKFRGLETIELSNTKHDCIKLEYAAEQKLFIPVENINLITKYGSENSSAQLDSLGGTSWSIKKAKAKEKIKDSAKYLMEIAAKRQLKKADILEISPGLYEEFSSTFPYAETEDQENAIQAITSDLSSAKPMDRLICGDTGFGKTEVAMRAAFIASKSNKQVALICPTTLLAKQHYKSFKARMEKFGINIALLSRLVTPKEAANTIENLNKGTIDLVIGTHALLNDKIKFKNLGLIIVDEEQHFGVAQKEKLKKLKDNVHVLTLSATPIPRTLQLSLTGIKDLSLIATPPVNRIATKTVIMKFDELIIKEALLNEYKRDGQSFYICPRIADLEAIEKLLSRIVPNLKFKKVHGQMAPTHIDNIMSEFCDGEFDILLCTSIIESGIDIPTANTLIVHKADHFGLSQMYQIKGRIGRSNIKSYAYFTFKNNSALKNITRNKLDILQKTESLGGGFSISSYDMDMRGYGNLVGEEQSGHIKDIGTELYQNMLKEAVEAIKADSSEEEQKSESFTPQINLGIPVYIPEEYITEFDIRLSIYRRIAELKSEIEIEAFAAEMIDRFGSIPEEFENLLITAKLKLLCYQCKIVKLDSNINGIAINFLESEKVDSDKILKFVINNSEKIKLKPDNKIVIAKSIKEDRKRLLYIEQFIKELKIVVFG